jgi:hypothetical protein
MIAPVYIAMDYSTDNSNWMELIKFTKTKTINNEGNRFGNSFSFT